LEENKALYNRGAEAISRGDFDPGMGHPANGELFSRDVLAFLKQSTAEDI